MKCPICGKEYKEKWWKPSYNFPAFGETLVDCVACMNPECADKVQRYPWFILCKSGNIYKWDSYSVSWSLFRYVIQDPKKIGGFRVMQS